MSYKADLVAVPPPVVRPERIEQQSPEMPWSREEAWRRFWTMGRLGQEVRRPVGDAHDAGIFLAIQMWRELLGFDRVRWDKLDGNLLDGYRARLRVGAMCWNEAMLRRQAELLIKLRENVWRPWEDLVREAIERGGYACPPEPQKGRLMKYDVDPYIAAKAFTNGWIGQRGELTWDSLVFDGIMLVECGVLEYAGPVWKDGGPTTQLRDLPVDLRAQTARMVPGIRMYEWMVRTGWDVPKLAEELGVSRETVTRWRLGQRPHNGMMAALRILSGGMITQDSFTPRKPPELRYVENALRRLRERRNGVKPKIGRPPGAIAHRVGLLDVGGMLNSLKSPATPGLVSSRLYTVPDSMLPGLGSRSEDDLGDEAEGE